MKPRAGELGGGEVREEVAGAMDQQDRDVRRRAGVGLVERALDGAGRELDVDRAGAGAAKRRGGLARRRRAASSISAREPSGSYRDADARALSPALVNSPSRIAWTVGNTSTVFGSWLTMMTVLPCSVASDLSRLAIAAALVESRLPVGSSARISAGSLASARATPTRCCSPPLSSSGRFSPFASRPDQPEQLARAGVALGLRRPGHHHRQLEVLERGDARDQVEELEDEADARAAGAVSSVALVHLREVLAVDQDRSPSSAGPRRRAGSAASSCRSRSGP